MEARSRFETSVQIYQTTRRHIKIYILGFNETYSALFLQLFIVSNLPNSLTFLKSLLPWIAQYLYSSYTKVQFHIKVYEMPLLRTISSLSTKLSAVLLFRVIKYRRVQTKSARARFMAWLGGMG